MDFKVILPSTETLNINLNSTKQYSGEYLTNKVFENLNITGDSKKYFGLHYPNKQDGCLTWLVPKDHLKNLHLTNNTVQLSVRIFPSNPELALSTNEARCFFRQHMKIMLGNGDIGCNKKTHAMLDSFVAQAELGDYDIHNKNYFKDLGNLEIYAPSMLSLPAAPISEIDYLKLVRMYHKQLVGTRSTQADILFLSLIQKLPLFGLNIYHISEKRNGGCFIALSEQGIHFIYDSYLERCSTPKRVELFSWGDLIFNQVEINKIKLGFFPQGGELTERKVKIKSKYSQNGAATFQADMEMYKELFVTNDDVFDSRKEAQRCYTTKIPAKNNSWNRKISSFRHSLSSLRRNKPRRQISNEEKGFTKMKSESPRRIHSE